MIEAKFIKGEASHSVSITGHAQFSRNGVPDIVCSAVSALVYTLVGALINLSDTPPNYELSPGRASILQARSDKADLLVEAAIIGISQIRQSYPDCVQVKIKTA